ncbi:MAG: TlpA family protein disulfide reductase [Proteobacteria bacterium]|nr:TlpA family protein disulfide reductase [Pseudomonadota bacterium]
MAASFPSRTVSDSYTAAASTGFDRRQLRRLIFLALALTVVAPTIASPPLVGQSAPLALGRGAKGKDVTVADFAGKVVVATFWASWCEPCREELPALENLQRAAKGSVQVVAVNMDPADRFPEVRHILRDFTLMLTTDPRHKAFAAYGVPGIPLMVIVGRDGRIASIHSGYGVGRNAQIADEVNAVLRADLGTPADPQVSPSAQQDPSR